MSKLSYCIFRVKGIVKVLAPSLIELSHDISEHPEVAFKEYRTMDVMCNLLARHNFKIRKHVGGLETSFIAKFGNAKHPAIAYIAEMDALPVIGHACGHNVNGAISIGAAITLSKVIKPDKACVAVIGTPAEEIGYGKPELIKHNVFKPFDVAMMSHASTKRMSYRYMLALKRIRIRFKGRSAHAAVYPEEGRDALSALILAINNINSLRAMFKPYMKVNGIITDGGKAPNIIPDFAEAYYFVRAISISELEELMQWIRNAVYGAGKATGTKAEIVEEGYTQYPFYVNEKLVEIYSDVLDTLGLKQTDVSPYTGIGSSDIGQLSYIMPTLHTYTPIGTGAHLHSPSFRKLAVSASADKGIVEGALVLALTGYRLITNPVLIKQIQKAHKPQAI
ncbi:MAG: amidohydrolase [bacterium]